MAAVYSYSVLTESLLEKGCYLEFSIAECGSRYILNIELFYGKAQENRTMLDLVTRMLLPFAFNDEERY